MKGQQKPKKLAKKAPVKSLKEKRAAKRDAAKPGRGLDVSARRRAAALLAPAVQLFRLEERLRWLGHRLWIMLLEPARGLVLGVEPDLAFPLATPLRALLRRPLLHRLWFTTSMLFPSGSRTNAP